MRLRLSVELVLLVVGIVSGISGCRENTSGPTAAPPVVTVAKPVTQTVTDYLTFTGNTAPTNSVTLVARVEGFLEKNHFTDGSRVKKSDLLFTIQQDQYKAQLQQAEAQLAAQKAALWHANTELARYTALLKEDAATQTQVESVALSKRIGGSRYSQCAGSGRAGQAQFKLHNGQGAVSTAASADISSTPATSSAATGQRTSLARDRTDRPYSTSTSRSTSATCCASSSAMKPDRRTERWSSGAIPVCLRPVQRGRIPP